MTMLRVLRQFFSISSTDFSDDEILHICGILYVNAHEVPVTSNPSQAMYRSASLVEHSCVNNASKHFDMNCNIQVSLIFTNPTLHQVTIINFPHPDSCSSANT